VIIKKIKYLEILYIPVLLLTLCAAGCGTLSIDLYTKVDSNGQVVQQIKTTGTGMMGSLMTEDQTMQQELKGEGWQVSISRSNDSSSLTMMKGFASIEEVLIPDFTGEESFGTIQDPIFLIEDKFLYKEYTLEITIPPSSVNSEEDEFSELGKAMMQEMLSLSWTIDIPGDIIQTNADEHNADSATWYFDISSFENGRTMSLRTRYINWLFIGIIVGVVIILLFLIIVRRRTAR
jgi:hypothetical protein